MKLTVFFTYDDLIEDTLTGKSDYFAQEYKTNLIGKDIVLASFKTCEAYALLTFNDTFRITIYDYIERNKLDPNDSEIFERFADAKLYGWRVLIKKVFKTPMKLEIRDIQYECFREIELDLE